MNRILIAVLLVGLATTARADEQTQILRDLQDEQSDLDRRASEARRAARALADMPQELAGMAILLFPDPPAVSTANPSIRETLQAVADRREEWRRRAEKADVELAQIRRMRDPQDGSVVVEMGEELPQSLPRRLAQDRQRLRGTVSEQERERLERRIARSEDLLKALPEAESVLAKQAAAFEKAIDDAYADEEFLVKSGDGAAVLKRKAALMTALEDAWERRRKFIAEVSIPLQQRVIADARANRVEKTIRGVLGR